MARDYEALAQPAWRAGIIVRPLDEDTLLFALNPDSALVPASNMKLLVAAVALQEWDTLLVKQLDARLLQSKEPLHLRLVGDSAFAESLGVGVRPDLPGFRYLLLLNRKSDNNVANWLIDAVASRRRTTRQLAVERGLRALDVPVTGLQVIDGSGLSSRNRVSARTIAATLAAVRRLPFGDAFANSLAQPGGIGTLLRRRFLYPQTLRAKTGYIRGVFCLSGYLLAPNREYVFSFLVNGCESGTLAYRLFDALLADVLLWDLSLPRGATEE